ncbi:nephrin-like isoform X1 [Amphibalanus amphitrite]|uniref:nephrin-like isoform X1 n=1 Tax=Amphibalanus amphitrite TaxID=1232801 RepID=UPI001C924E1C|nr:nephrin-like isoform X1 [Amphibalanus amphitrite]
MLPKLMTSPALLVTFLISIASADLDTTSQLTRVTAVEGETAELPCDVTPPVAGDELRLVLWYYGTGGTPIYTYDSRNRNQILGEHWVDSTLDRNRIQFQPDARPAHLRVTGVQRADQRLYRCRVDFLHSPTRNSRVNLTVIVPPGTPVVTDDKGQVVERGQSRRHREGQMLHLTCRSSGGSPLPNVTWWRGSTLVDSSWEEEGNGTVVNQLTAGPLSRDDLDASYTCWAANHKRSLPKATKVAIDMLLRPLTVNLLGTNNPLSAGVTYQLTCQSVGSRPAATITWWMGGQKLRLTNQTSSHDGNVTTSKVTLTPRIEDSGQLIRCQASNPLLRNSIEDLWRLKIRYAPQVQLTVRPSRPHDVGVREGDQVSMECSVKANPPPLRVVWKRDGLALVSDPRRNINLDNSSLTLYDVTRAESGNYSCEAFNDEGTGTSVQMPLRVQYAPACQPDHVTHYPVSRGETVNITCRVTSEPAPFRFVWAFNTSTGSMIDIPESSWSSDGHWSVCRYTPRTRLDYGQLLCWAENDLAMQSRPCVFNITPAERPEGLSNCSVVNSTSQSLQVHCAPGKDGGLRQAFSLEVQDAVTEERVTGVSDSDRPSFSLTGLKPGSRYRLTVFASNAKGRSDRYISYAQTPEEVAQGITAPDTADPEEPSGFRMTPILGILIGIVGVLVLSAIVIVVVIRTCTGSRRKKSCPSVTQLNTGLSGSQSLDLKEKQQNPDIVPTEFMDPEEKHMIERLSNPTPRTLRSQSRGYSSGYHSPCSTLGSLKSQPQYTRRPPDDMQLRGDAQYTSVPCLTQKLANCGQPGALPAMPAHDEISPFLPHLEHRESSDSSDMETFMSRTSCSASQETVINMAEARLSTQF